MNTYRKNAVLVGVLYIIGTVSGILSVIFTGSIMDAPDYLVEIAANETRMIAGALCVLTMGLSLSMVPVAIFPILKKYNEALALAYLVFRGALEAITDVIIVISWFLLIILSQEYAHASAPDAGYFQTIGTILVDGGDRIGEILTIVFSLGALVLYYVLYQTKLTPRWVSIWGFIAITLHLVSGFLTLFGILEPFSTGHVVMNLPIFLQEMVMAVWFIVKGFNLSELAPGAVPMQVKKRVAA